MTALTIRLPEDKYERLKALAKRRGISMNAQINELIAPLLSDHDDTEIRFAQHQKRGRGKYRRGLALLRQAAGKDR